MLVEVGPGPVLETVLALVGPGLELASALVEQVSAVVVVECEDLSIEFS